MPLSCTLYCHCAYAGVLPAGVRTAAMNQLCSDGGAFLAVDDLCGLAAERADIAGCAGPGSAVVACHERAVRNLTRWAYGWEPARVLDMRQTASAKLVSQLADLSCEASAGQPNQAALIADIPQLPPDRPAVLVYEGPQTAAIEPGRLAELASALLAKGFWVFRPGIGRPVSGDAARWIVVGCFMSSQPRGAGLGPAGHVFDASRGTIEELVTAAQAAATELGQERIVLTPPWFPVIDERLCNNCGQCKGFCLFGVYDKPEGRIRVTNPRKCKPNCPACARVCPAGAIIFPKFDKAPINGGCVDVAAAPGETDLNKVLQGDVYAALRRRDGQVGPLPSTDQLTRAIEERRRCARGSEADVNE